MEFGIALKLLHDAKAEARMAEDLSFDYLVTGEHISFHIATSNNIVGLAAAAGVTERIKLLSGIVLVPLYPPALLAKQVAMLDVVSGGRFSLGVGVGGEFPREFEAVGVPVKERGVRTDEALEVLELLLTQNNVNFDGRFTTLNDITISPKPIQKPSVPVWVAGRKAAAMKRAARFGTRWMPYMYTPAMLAESMRTVSELCVEHGRRSDAVQGAAFVFTCVHPSRDRALELANEQLSKQYNQDFAELVGKYTISGSPDDCIDQINEYRAAGASTIIFAQGCPPEYVDANTRLISETLLPAFR